MTREEAKEILTHNWTRVDNPNYSESELDEAFFMAIKALSTPSGDLISRQWLLDVYGDYIGDNGEPKYYVPLEVVRQNIKDAPSAELVRCKDCRYFKKIAERSDSGLCHRDIVASAWKENGYCSRGERND